MGDLNFNSAEVPPSSGFPKPPEGWHDAKIVSAEVKDDDDKKYLLVKFELLSNPKLNAMTRIYFKNPDPDKQKSGEGILSGLCHAAGRIGMINNASELLECKLAIKVKYNGDYVNVNAYEKIKSSMPVAPSGVPQSMSDDDIPF